MLKAESSIIGAEGLAAQAVRTEFRCQHHIKAGLVRPVTPALIREGEQDRQVPRTHWTASLAKMVRLTCH